MWMTDEAYTLQETNRERSIVKKSAAHRKGGARSKRCSLPSDGMTRRQWERRNGEVITYNTSKPMTYSDYKRLPDYAKREFLNNCVGFGGSVQAIADMLGISRVTMSKQFASQEIPLPGHANRGRAAAEAWARFLAQDEPAPVQAAAEPEITHAEPVPDKSPAKIAPCKGRINLVGTLPEVCGWLLSHLEGGRYSIDVEFTRLEEGGDA